MGRLAVLPNIGVRLEEQLNVIGIDTPDQLMQLGSCETWRKLKQLDQSVNLTRLYALEGAVRGIRWHHLDDAVKQELRAFALQVDQAMAAEKQE